MQDLAAQLTAFIKTQNSINDTVMNALMLAHDEIAHLKDTVAQMTNEEIQIEEETEPQIN